MVPGGRSDRTGGGAGRGRAGRRARREPGRAARRGGAPLGAREGEASPGKTALYGGLRTSYAPPWELALQRWLEGVAAGVRSYERPSRRAVAQSDVVLAGRRREGWTLHIVLDTSGSMQDELSRALGAIGAFCDSVNVGAVRLLQCDCEVTRDDWVAPDALAGFEIAGFGGSDLSPALLRLAEDPTVEAAVVITDGEIGYPEAPPPYAVLWVLTAPNEEFAPPYGALLALPPLAPAVPGARRGRRARPRRRR